MKPAQCEDNSKSVWKNVKGILNWKLLEPPIKFSTRVLADAQNEYFIEKITTIRENLPPPTSDPLLKLKSLMIGRQCTLYLSCAHPDEVDKIVAGLSNSTSFSLDNILIFDFNIFQNHRIQNYIL